MTVRRARRRELIGRSATEQCRRLDDRCQPSMGDTGWTLARVVLPHVLAIGTHRMSSTGAVGDASPLEVTPNRRVGLEAGVAGVCVREPIGEEAS